MIKNVTLLMLTSFSMIPSREHAQKEIKQKLMLADNCGRLAMNCQIHQSFLLLMFCAIQYILGDSSENQSMDYVEGLKRCSSKPTRNQKIYIPV